MIEVEILNGSGDFNICGTRDCTIFEFRNRSKIMAWEMDWNTLMNFYVGKVAKQPIFFPEAYFELALQLENGTVDLENMEELFTPVLMSFSNAKYRLEIASDDSFYVIEPGNNSDYAEYGNWGIAYAIQNSTNEKAIDFYKNLIAEGKRPQGILLKTIDSEIKIILDGHHKFKAYGEVKEAPNYIQITKLNNFEVDKNSILKSFDKMNTVENLREKLEFHLKEINKN